MRLFGLIGHPLSHSSSKKIFEEKFVAENIGDCRYELFDLDTIRELGPLKSNPYLTGLNVTIPYKQSLIPYLDDLSEEARLIGAVNVIKIRNGKWTGYNTDIFGFEKSLVPLLTPSIKQALIIGSGGSSMAVQYVLNKLSIPFKIVSRKANPLFLKYQEISKGVLNSCPLIINTTPVGMFPNISELPAIPFHLLNPDHLVYDLIYNPEETLLLKNASFIGCRTKNGLEMLQLQAEKSWQIWNEPELNHSGKLAE